ncbi:hypothetical protein [Streptomyces coelicoflavus]|uniref:hypothetical protein n=1 Tax=Streptomyces coelicoflavus TaxID=285562 RepID=UPI003F4A5D2C
MAIALGTLTTFMLSVSPASAADPAGWQSIGNRDFGPTSGSQCDTSIVYSGGGWIRTSYYRPGHPDDQTLIGIWEYDADNADEHITNISIQDGQAYENLVADYTDGSNGKAEIYYVGPCTGAPWVHVDD